ncbi:hypothetical protein [Abyssisolibacter fermentans]|uniref:hypothetical protein n=1 Tax=Abyssisolibacter fermentans TaxID=1766203 RepID=UPI00082CE56A|nr:hypothetical protein [Abyssisolibacter fermentans]
MILLKPYIKFIIIFSIIILTGVLLSIRFFHSEINNNTVNNDKDPLEAKFQSFDSIVKIDGNQPYKLEERCSGTGVLYVSYDKKLINEFIGLFKNKEYLELTEFEGFDLTGNSPKRFKDKDDNIIFYVYFVNEGVANINSRYYIITGGMNYEKYKELHNNFITDENIQEENW